VLIYGTGKNGSAEKDPLYGFQGLKELYLMVNPDYTGRFTVPCLFDKKTETIVNNESSEIIRMFYTEFDDLLPEKLREEKKEVGGFYPEHLRKEIDEMNEWGMLPLFSSFETTN
jgi:glutathionyl-hydroquinone reductase